MNDKQLEAFIQITECGSFSQAEQLLFTSKQALAKRINSLENEIGFTLFYRGAKGIELTEAGKEFYQGAKEMLKLQKEVLERSRAALLETKALRINKIESHMLMDKITYRFTEKYPEIELIPVMHHSKNERLRVAQGIADIGESPKIPEIDELNLNYTKLIELPYVCLMKDDHPLRNEKKITLKQLSEYPVTVDLRQFESNQIELIQSTIPALHLTTSVADQIQEAFQICTQGSIFLTPAFYTRYLKPLKAIPLESEWKREYGLVTRKDAPKVVNDYLELAKQIYR